MNGCAWGVLLLAACVSCGKTKGEGVFSGADAAGAGGDDSGLEPPIEVPLDSGTCGIVRRIPIPGSAGSDQVANPAQDAEWSFVTRQAGGFGVGPWASGDQGQDIHARLLDGSGRQRASFFATGAQNDVNWALLLGDAAVQVYVDGFGPGGSAPSFGVRSWHNGDASPADHGTLLEAYWRGTDLIAAAPALDGQHAVFAIWPVALGGPVAALIGPDGAPVGDARQLAPPADKFSHCGSVTPTNQGGLVSFIDDTDKVLHIIELGNSAGGLDYSQVMQDNMTCPVLAVSAAGVSFLNRTADSDTQVTLYQVEPAGVTNTMPLTLHGQPLALSQTPGGQLVLELVPGGYALQLFGETDAREFSLSVPLDYFRVVPGEPGSIFLDAKTTAGPRELLEISCR